MPGSGITRRPTRQERLESRSLYDALNTLYGDERDEDQGELFRPVITFPRARRGALIDYEISTAILANQYLFVQFWRPRSAVDGVIW